MQIEITGTSLANRIITIEGHSTDELNLIHLERGREDRIQTLVFQFDTTDEKQCKYIVKWLGRQKATKEANTYGEAVKAVLGTITDISQKYRVYEAV